MEERPERNPITNDGPGHPIINVSTRNGEHIRVTYLPVSYNERDAALRFNIIDANNHPRPGPEVPVTCIGELVEAISKMMVERGHW